MTFDMHMKRNRNYVSPSSDILEYVERTCLAASAASGGANIDIWASKEEISW